MPDVADGERRQREGEQVEEVVELADYSSFKAFEYGVLECGLDALWLVTAV